MEKKRAEQKKLSDFMETKRVALGPLISSIVRSSEIEVVK